jgi:methylated-DNA-[protein]-cysteine S-methyltransferase
MRNLERELARAAREDEGGVEAAAARLPTAADERGLLDVAYAVLDSPLGPVVAAATPRGLVRLAYEDGQLDQLLADLAKRVSPRLLEAPARLDPARRELDEYFAGRRERFDLPLDLGLTHGFRRRVLQAARRIPFGGTSTYTRMAARAGSERAVRAAGSALGANPIPIVVPCHRVMRADGSLGGYGGGLERKRFLLELESGAGA